MSVWVSPTISWDGDDIQNRVGIYFKEKDNMSNYSSLKATVNANVNTNGNQEITGAIMNSVLIQMINSLGAGYQYMGVATPSTNPGTPDQRVLYVAATAGTYANFGNIVISENEVAILSYDSGWSKTVTGCATQEAVRALSLYDYKKIQFEYGGVSTTGTLQSGTTRIRVTIPVDTSVTGTIRVPANIVSGLIVHYSYAYLGGVSGTKVKAMNNGAVTLSNGDLVFTSDGTFDTLVVSMRYSNNATISQADLDVCCVYLTTVKEQVHANELAIEELSGQLDYDYHVGFEYGGVSTTGTLQTNTTRIRVTIPVDTSFIGTVRVPAHIVSGLIVHYSYAYMGGVTGTKVKAMNNGAVAYNNGDLVFASDGTFDTLLVSMRFSNDASISQATLDDCYIVLITPIKEQVRSNTDNIDQLLSLGFVGKKLCALGDSITHGFPPRNNPDGSSYIKSFTKLTAERLGMDYVDYGVDGSTLAYSNKSPMCVRYTAMPDDADLVCVMGGTNDVRDGISLGAFTDRINTTFYGALHILLGGLYKKYFIDQGVDVGKTKKIVICVPPKLLSSPSETEGGEGTLLNMDGFCTAIKEVAAYYSIPVFDFQNLSYFNPHLDETLLGVKSDGVTQAYYNPYVPDGTHPRQQMAEIMCDSFIGFLKKLQ